MIHPLYYKVKPSGPGLVGARRKLETLDKGKEMRSRYMYSGSSITHSVDERTMENGPGQ